MPCVLVSGSSGLIGSALVRALAADGVRVVRLTHGALAGPDVIRWAPERAVLDQAALDRLPALDAVIHLAGARIDHRWTARRRRAIVTSRIVSTALLSRAVAGLRSPPGTFLSASAIGYYGNGGDAELDESSPSGTGFVAEVCRAWEAAAAPARAAGLRVLHIRCGIVLSAAGGALARLLPAYRLGLGGPIGDGRQWMSWIALEDMVAAMRFALATATLDGPINLTAPAPVKNAAFAAALGRVLRRPARLPVPAWAVRALFGQMGTELLLEGQRVLPHALERAGYVFRHPDLAGALGSVLGR
jgi:uncharacterized protein (TIGR01777 family)